MSLQRSTTSLPWARWMAALSSTCCDWLCGFLSSPMHTRDPHAASRPQGAASLHSGRGPAQRCQAPNASGF